MTDLRKDPLRVEEVLAGLRDPAEVDPRALAAAQLQEERFQQEILPRTLDAVLNQGARRGGVRPVRLALVSSLATAAAVVLVVFLWTAPPAPVVPDPGRAASEEEYVGVRGGPTLDLRILRDGRVIRWGPGDALRAGDAVRLVPFGQGYEWILVLAVDGAGKTQVVVPFDGQVSRPIRIDGEPLPGSLVLDDVPGREALVAVFSRDALDAGDAAALAGVSPEQRVENGSRSLRDGAVVVVGIAFEKEVR
ncbi:MAG: hypothetical protein ABIK09_13085 [Pseudomonadota bacterium]